MQDFSFSTVKTIINESNQFEYIVFLHDDDLLNKNYLKKLYISENNVFLLFILLDFNPITTTNFTRNF